MTAVPQRTVSPARAASCLRYAAIAFVCSFFGLSALAQPISNGGLPTHETLRALEFQERALLENYGADHPQVRAVREQLAMVREFLASRPIYVPPQPSVIQAIHVQPTVSEPIRTPAPLVSTAPKPAPPPRKKNIPKAPPPITKKVEPAPVLIASAPLPTPVVVTVEPPAPKADPVSCLAMLKRCAGVLAAFAIGLLGHAIALGWMLRRYAARPAAPMEAASEIASSASNQPHEDLPPTAEKPASGEEPSAGTLPRSGETESEVREPFGNHVAQPANGAIPPEADGQSRPDWMQPFGNVLQQKENARQQQDEGIFRHIFQQNVQLQSQLREISRAN